MAEDIVEKITSQGVTVSFKRDPSNLSMEFGSKTELISTAAINPPNMDKPDGPTLKMLVGEGVSIELSKRRSTMPFWHRNMDFDEVIICIKGSATWKTEHGTYTLKSGDILYIPRGVSHTASAEKTSDYQAIEIKSRAPLQNKLH
ncbi:MAG TPA: cupin domain-containing protein [Thermoplasmataceae archaeon]|nr:cupin domain-containing protein [Thermoplasmatales archaeon AK]HLH85304.1 cupin domain-containing protein [Thermoplasmataceae archaeon]